MKRKTILFVTLGDWDSVACVRPREFAKYLASAGWDVTIGVMDTPSNKTVSECCSIAIEKLPLGFSRFLFAIRRLITKRSIDFVYFLNPSARAVLAGVGLPNKNLVFDWEDWNVLTKSNKTFHAIKLIDFLARNQANVLLTASKWLQDRFLQLGHRSVHYVPYACLPRAFPSLPNPFPEPTAVFMGNFYPNWDHDILVDAFEQLMQIGVKLRVNMIGGGPDLDKVRVNVRERGLEGLVLTGFLPWDEMLNQLQWAKVLLFPIRNTPLNNARCPFKVYQYAQSRRPVITSRVGEVPNVLGEHGIYVDCTPDAFADSIHSVMSSSTIPPINYELDLHSWQERGRRLELALFPLLSV